MPVPPVSALRAGVGVNIVLKVNQRSGKLTSGRIADVLTHGNHPRGVKVRLQDGQVGRVQSLSDNIRASQDYDQGSAGEPRLNGPSLSTSTPQDTVGGFSNPQGRTAKVVNSSAKHAVLPPDTRSLGDYVTFKPPKNAHHRERAPPSQSEKDGSTSTNNTSRALDGNQQILQDEFPQIDSALIAAILSDGQTVEDARSVLSALA